MKPLLDTHILLWWFEKAKELSSAQRRVLDKASPQNPIYVSDITLWEIATLVDLGRVRLAIPLRQWLDHPWTCALGGSGLPFPSPEQSFSIHPAILPQEVVLSAATRRLLSARVSVSFCLVSHA